MVFMISYFENINRILTDLSRQSPGLMSSVQYTSFAILVRSQIMPRVPCNENVILPDVTNQRHNM